MLVIVSCPSFYCVYPFWRLVFFLLQLDKLLKYISRYEGESDEWFCTTGVSRNKHRRCLPVEEPNDGETWYQDSAVNSLVRRSKSKLEWKVHSFALLWGLWCDNSYLFVFLIIFEYWSCILWLVRRCATVFIYAVVHRHVSCIHASEVQFTP
jgi:hypothetical protein